MLDLVTKCLDIYSPMLDLVTKCLGIYSPMLDLIPKCFFISMLLYTYSPMFMREKESTRPALPYDYTCFEDGTPFEKEFFKRKGRLLIF